MKFIQEDLRTSDGTEGSLLIAKKIYDTLWPEVEKMVLPRELAAIFIGPGQIPGSSIDVDKVNPRTLNVRVAGEGAEIWKSNEEYTSANIKPRKYGVRINITREMMEDGKFPLLQNSIRTAGRRMTENETKVIITNALDSANTTTSPGTALTISDVVTGMLALWNEDYAATDMIIGTEAMSDLLNIDTFVEADKFGSRSTLESGKIASFFGMTLHMVSPNAMPAPSTDKKDVYIIDRNHAYILVVKRPITVETYTDATHDIEGVAITQRLWADDLRAKAMYKISTS